MRILLAEDERELSDALVAILKHNNYSVDASIMERMLLPICRQIIMMVRFWIS